MKVSVIASKGSPSGADGVTYPTPEHAWVSIKFNDVVVVEKGEVIAPFNQNGESRTYIEFEAVLRDNDNTLEITNLQESGGMIRIHAFCHDDLLSKNWHTAIVDGVELTNEFESWSNIERVKPGSSVFFNLDDLI